MLEWAFTHPEFKTQLFRLVDVFPRCRDADDVLRHLSEYFDGVPVPRAVGLGLDLAEHVPFGDAVSATVARRNIRRMARQFIAGADRARQWPCCSDVGAGEAITVDLLGEKMVSDAEAEHYAARVDGTGRRWWPRRGRGRSATSSSGTRGARSRAPTSR